MTSDQRMLLDARAAHCARTTYQKAADRNKELARELWRDGWTNWSRQVAGFARIAQRAARSEYGGHS